MLETMKKWDFEWKKINLFTVFQQWKHNVVSSCTYKIKAQKMLQKWCKSSLSLIPTNFIYWSGKIQPNILHLEALFCNMDNCCSQKVKIHMTLLNTRIVPTKNPPIDSEGVSWPILHGMKYNCQVQWHVSLSDWQNKFTKVGLPLLHNKEHIVSRANVSKTVNT